MRIFAVLICAMLLAAAGSSSASKTSNGAESVNEFAMEHALHADAASSEIPREDRIYDRLIGSWKARVIDYDDDGSKREGRGEWHFGYVLEGRAVQDVWISPSRVERSTNASIVGNRYGTSIRSYDAVEKRWHVTWINPVSGAINLLVARRDGGDIVQEGRDDDGNTMRWVFTDIEEDSARWYGERSMDGGRTWRLDAEFFLRRD
jgi:uncharacterized protein